MSPTSASPPLPDGSALRVARVVIDLSLDREFDYLIPDQFAGRVRVGSRVHVPFGSAAQARAGYVVGLKASSAFPGLKAIVGIVGDREQIPENLIRLADD